INDNTDKISSYLNSETKGLGKIAKDFNNFQKSNQDYFITQFEKYFNGSAKIAVAKEPAILKSFDKAYKRALRRSRLNKSVRLDCNLPNSQQRIMSNKSIKRFTNIVNLTSYGLAYGLVHGDKEMDVEWWTRL